jgi:energy-converting hydrogenase Eha subunit G
VNPDWATARLFFLLAWLLLGVLLLACAPGWIARRRGHPSAQAIGIAGILGLVIWPLWLVAFIWAYTGPDARTAPLLTCDGCGQPLAVAHAVPIGRRLFCPACAQSIARGAAVVNRKG